MKRTVFHTAKQYMNDPFNQSASLFPFLNSTIVESYSKSIIKYKKTHAICNHSNISQIVPFSELSKQFIFFGRSNVGKSTLLNKLMQCQVAAVSKRPGKTKQLMFCQVGTNNPVDMNMIQFKIYFVDAPGYGFATGVSKSEINKWGKLISTYLKRTKQNSLNQKIFVLLDLTHDLKQTDAIIFELLKSLGKNFQIVFTKCDKFDAKQDMQQNETVKKGLEISELLQSKYQNMSYYVHFTSGKTMIGIDNLRNQVMFDIVSNKI